MFWASGHGLCAAARADLTRAPPRTPHGGGAAVPADRQIIRRPGIWQAVPGAGRPCGRLGPALPAGNTRLGWGGGGTPWGRWCQPIGRTWAGPAPALRTRAGCPCRGRRRHETTRKCAPRERRGRSARPAARLRETHLLRRGARAYRCPIARMGSDGRPPTPSSRAPPVPLWPPATRG
jgi:hypothetical protein